ncbi:aldehyde dehydrogenase [Acetivibrio straminisolvens JCM 21531]|uniref:Aldehyde dehydrogenase n=1 Tax=Acetivibrio straminisolvens JCM 21531 TaxID=1294263 RepID=W4VE21_9FIRM|nr:aldehyde dehydrogenase [Acetivibrio straminisolvens JCM 21531]
MSGHRLLDVSILVLLEVPLQQAMKRRGNMLKEVSILVLLEVPLQLVQEGKKQTLIFLFQSLFYWKYLFNLLIFTSTLNNIRVFQSLFYWKYLFNV